MQAWAGFAGAAAVVWVGVRTRNAFNLWLKQKQTERRLDVAERAILVVYKAEDVFKSIRSPMSSGGEVERVKESLENAFRDSGGVPHDRRRTLEIAQTALLRVDEHGDFWTEYLALRPVVRAFFGSDYAKAYAKIGEARGKIIAAAQVYGRLEPAAEEQDRAAAREARNKWEAIFWSGWAEAIDKPDEIADLLKDVVTQTEAVVQPLLATESATL